MLCVGSISGGANANVGEASSLPQALICWASSSRLVEVMDIKLPLPNERGRIGHFTPLGRVCMSPWISRLVYPRSILTRVATIQFLFFLVAVDLQEYFL